MSGDGRESVEEVARRLNVTAAAARQSHRGDDGGEDATGDRDPRHPREPSTGSGETLEAPIE
jgi:hypothetical protein